MLMDVIQWWVINASDGKTTCPNFYLSWADGRLLMQDPAGVILAEFICLLKLNTWLLQDCFLFLNLQVNVCSTFFLHIDEYLNNLWLHTVSFHRAVQLGLTAEDLMSVQEYTQTLKEKRKPESAATIIKREVAMEESHMRVRLGIVNILQKCFLKLSRKYCNNVLAI